MGGTPDVFRIKLKIMTGKILAEFLNFVCEADFNNVVNGGRLSEILTKKRVATK